jgi:hypothetical protein
LWQLGSVRGPRTDPELTQNARLRAETDETWT